MEFAAGARVPGLPDRGRAAEAVRGRGARGARDGAAGRGVRPRRRRSATSSRWRRRGRRSCAASRWRRSCRTSRRTARPGSRRTRWARGCRAPGRAGRSGGRSEPAGPRRAACAAARTATTPGARLGLPPLDHLHTGLSRSLTLVATLPHLEYPRDWQPWMRVVGPLMWEPPGEEVLPPDGRRARRPRRAVDRPRRRAVACCSPSLRGLADEPVRVIATWNGREPPWLGTEPVPANAVLVPWLSYAKSMPRCDLVVTHGGHGTLVRALTNGCAVVVCPAAGDMFENAARADWAGLGVRLPRRLLSRGTLRLAVRRALRDPAIRARARAVAAWSASHDAATAAAAEVERWAAGCVRVVDADPGWADAFEAEAARVREALGALCTRVDHTGSTSVPGLAAKPILDLQVSVTDLDVTELERRLAPLGYVHVRVPDDALVAEYPFFGRPARGTAHPPHPRLPRRRRPGAPPPRLPRLPHRPPGRVRRLRRPQARPRHPLPRRPRGVHRRQGRVREGRSNRARSPGRRRAPAT